MTDRLIALFAEELDVDPAALSDASSPDTVENWDSLAAMRLVAAIESEFDVRLSTREAMKMRTIGIVRAVLADKNVKL
jgi:acyl carrier protein